MAKFFLLLRTRSVLVNEPFNNSRRSPSISQRAHPFAIKTAITATKQPFISAFRTDQRMGRTHPPHTCSRPQHQQHTPPTRCFHCEGGEKLSPAQFSQTLSALKCWFCSVLCRKMWLRCGRCPVEPQQDPSCVSNLLRYTGPMFSNLPVAQLHGLGFVTAKSPAFGSVDYCSPLPWSTFSLYHTPKWDISTGNQNILKTTCSKTEYKVKHRYSAWPKEHNVPPDLIMSKRSLLQGTHTLRCLRYSGFPLMMSMSRFTGNTHTRGQKDTNQNIKPNYDTICLINETEPTPLEGEEALCLL